MPVGARIAGKAPGISSNNYNGNCILIYKVHLSYCDILWDFAFLSETIPLKYYANL